MKIILPARGQSRNPRITPAWLRLLVAVTHTDTEREHAEAVANADLVGRIVALSKTPINDGAP